MAYNYTTGKGDSLFGQHINKFIGLIAVLFAGAIALLSAGAFAAPLEKVDVCHYSEDTGTYKLINISSRAVDKHIENHGDFLAENGECVMDVDSQAGEGWPSQVIDGYSLDWQAEGRYGDSAGVATWELGVGNNTQLPGMFDQAQNKWQNGVAVPFTVEYDGSIATFTVDGVSVDYNVGAVDSTDNLYIIANGDSDVGEYVDITNLTLNGTPLSDDDVYSDGPVMHLAVDGVDLSSGFTLEGMVEFAWVSTSGSATAFQVQVGE